ncbi:MAG: riboflavin synthase, partial [Pseudomonadota bacterium]
MFTGLVTDIGVVQSAEDGRFQIGCAYDLNEDSIGASIACDGCCLTVVETQPGPDGLKSIFAVDVSNETLSKTTLGSWKTGDKINLERSLTPTTELGG